MMIGRAYSCVRASDQLAIGAIKGKEFFVGASLGDPAVAEDQDFVGISNRVDTIGDDQGSASAGAKPFFDMRFRLRIKGGSRAVKHEDGGVSGEASSDFTLRWIISSSARW